MVKAELIESDRSYTINIEDEDFIITITYVNGWYDYQWNLTLKKIEMIESDFSEENHDKWKSNGILIPASSEIYPYFLELFDDFSKGKKAKYVEEYGGYFNEHTYLDIYDVENKTITWSTDEYRVDDKDDTNFQIIKTEDGIKIVFNYVHRPMVRVCTNGSRQGDFYIPFMQLSNNLKFALKTKEKRKSLKIR